MKLAALLVPLLALQPASAAGDSGKPVYSVPYCGPGAKASVSSNLKWWATMLQLRESLTEGLGRGFCNTTKGNLYADNMWASRQYVCPQSLIMDRFLYDRENHTWTVHRFLQDFERRYGGVDCVMLWQSYTNLGVDNRNQIDELRSVPGGIAGLTEVVRQFHLAGVTVLFPWNHWGNNTGHIEPDANFVKLLSTVGADGFNTDSGGRSLVPGQRGYKPDPHQVVVHGFDGTGFVKQGLSQHLKFNHHDLLDQPEHASGCPPDLILGGWAGEGGGPGPGACVECAKFVEPRHLSQWVERNQKYRQPGLKWAWFNGNGYNTWENNWGWWNGISPRDGETMRRVFTIFRAFANTTSSCTYRPFYPYLEVADPRIDAAATLFPSNDRVLLTVVNTVTSTDRTTPIGQFNATFHAANASWKWFDLWNGRAVTPVVAMRSVAASVDTAEHNRADEETDRGFAVDVVIPGTSEDEYGAIAGVSAEVASSPAFLELLATMSRLSKSPISSFSNTPGGSLEYEFKINSNGTVPKALNKTGMVAVPETTSYTFRYQKQKVGATPTLGPVYPVPASEYGTKGVVPPKMAIGAFVLDKYPVTNSQYEEFLSASHYSPSDTINFLRHWDNGTGVPANLTHSPVVWVSLADAQAYCGFYGKRLPEEWEWAFASQGSDGRLWPWGDAQKPACMPSSFNGNGSPALSLPAVHAFDTQGCSSPVGAEMLVGTVWQWTNELQDQHTATAILKGGSTYFREHPDVDPAGKPRSFYYFANCATEAWPWSGTPVRPIECHAQYYLMDGGYERASTIGFRCAADNGPKPPQPPPPPPPPPPPKGDLRWFGGSDSPAGAYTWGDGTPDKEAKGIRSGMYSVARPFGLTVAPAMVRPTDGVLTRFRSLKVYVGAFCTGGTLTVSSGTASVVQKTLAPPTGQCTHETGTRNVVWLVTFDASLPLTAIWARTREDNKDINADNNDKDGSDSNLTFQSASLSEGGICAVKICISDPVTVDPSTVTDLTADGTVDWVHWGGMSTDPVGSASLIPPLFPERKFGGTVLSGFVNISTSGIMK